MAIICIEPENPAAPRYYDMTYHVIRMYRHGELTPLFLGEKRRFVPFAEARQFDSLQDAGKCISRMKKGSRLFEIRTISELYGPFYPRPEAIMDLLESVPIPYLFIATEWFNGWDARPWLFSRSRSTYYRYRRKLLEYGIDISRKSKVVTLRPM